MKYNMKKNILLILLLASTLWILSGCSGDDSDFSSKNNADNNQPKTITAEEAKLLMDKSEVTVVDVRTQEEYNAQHIPQAILVPLDQIQSGNFENLPDKSATLLVYCRSGNRSSTAADLLAENGYTDVYDFGGIIDWNYEVE